MGYGAFIDVLTGDFECNDKDTNTWREIFQKANISLNLYCVNRTVQQEYLKELEERCKENGLLCPETGGGGYDLSSLSQDNIYIIIPIDFILFILEHRETIEILIRYFLSKIIKYKDSQKGMLRKYTFNVEISDPEKAKSKLLSVSIESNNITEESTTELSKHLIEKLFS